MSGRTLAIGDIHGHRLALDAVLDAAKPVAGDLLIFLGDYVHKGPDTCGVLNRLIELEISPIETIFLRGNHDQMLIDAYEDESLISTWEILSGDRPLAGYFSGWRSPRFHEVPDTHWNFLIERTLPFHETEEFIFVHGGISPHCMPEEETVERLYWAKLDTAEPHHSGRTVICGHTSQDSGEIADLGHTICIDTGISKERYLTCLQLDDWNFWQSSPKGEVSVGYLR